MIPEKLTCATCSFARHLDGDRYVCSATHNHHNPVTRGHWEATADCEQVIEEEGHGSDGDAGVEYVMQLEASLEKVEAQAVQQEQFSWATASAGYGVEVDSIKLDSYRIWVGASLIGTMRYTSRGWIARPTDGVRSWHATPDAAQKAVVFAALSH